MRLFYNTGIYLLDAGLHAAGMFNDKARLWCRGRRRIFSRMAEAGAGRTGVRIRFPYVVPRPKNVQERGTVRIIARPEPT